MPIPKSWVNLREEIASKICSAPWHCFGILSMMSKHLPTSSFSVAVISQSCRGAAHNPIPSTLPTFFLRSTLRNVHSSSFKHTHAQVHGHIQTGTIVCTDTDVHACMPPAGLHNVTLLQSACQLSMISAGLEM